MASATPLTLPPRLSVIIPAYREAACVMKCLDSLIQSRGIESAEIIVVDDCSNDETPDLVTRRFPQVKLIRRAVNGGFAAACNTGLAAANPASPYLALLNSDTSVEGTWAITAMQALENDASLASIAPRIVQSNDERIIDSAGLCYTISGWAYRRGNGKRFGPPYDRPAEVFGATGCAMVVRRAALDGMLFQEQLGCYYEDVELALRLRRAGWKCLYLPDSIVRHKVSASYARQPALKAFHVSRNIELLFWRNLPKRHRWHAILTHQAMNLAHGALHLFRGQLRPFLRGKIEARQMLRLTSPAS